MPAAQSSSSVPASRRWLQLLLGLIAMMAISSPQYVWTLFVKSFQTSLGASLAEIQVTFSILIVLQTWLSPLQGWLVERFGPRLLITLGTAMSGASWVLSAYVTSTTMLFLVYGGLGGIGTGIVYIGIVGLMVKWFPDHRGFATGMVAAGYGFGAILTTFPIADMLTASGYQHTLIVFGIILGVVGMLAGLGMRVPGTLLARKEKAASAAPSVAPGQMLRTPTFWLLFAMMTMMSTGGLMVVSQFAAFARDFGVAQLTVFGLAALPLALTVDRVTNGLTRPFFGWVSDHIGRENTMALAFLLEAAAVSLMLAFRSDPLLFVLLSGLVFFGWGEIFSLFPSTLTDSFGPEYATTNYGFLYMAQGIGSVLGGPVAALIHEAAASWVPVFILIVAMDTITGILALTALKSIRRRAVVPAPLVLATGSLQRGSL